mmetsp:Transcript_16788/g.21392  ORF Transcript_16788/g.21392 Transcript_16788/m.21392 type:complete len:221 (+) Transcript_16788:1083-1745(+)|eukprot:CAMPEP_0206205360 /NCGR_PEP_ID=MMETSP0166-20121206/14173_1 /ASSEMBLY_ACC=CAM_ASM_000260 /TAXON_ID=95228 /ORGANISM="Vannella robusta, Strain DIVA3 518/3/11/1/6" /LENGTH=220 /DNA_ID=CAMNT_0053625363 /DNA_START=1021 /DNA_END=1683 /DNA_ORIENTATION=+
MPGRKFEPFEVQDIRLGLEHSPLQDTRLWDSTQPKSVFYCRYTSNARALEIQEKRNSCTTPVYTWKADDEWLCEDGKPIARPEAKKLSMHKQTSICLPDGKIMAVCRTQTAVASTHMPLIWLLTDPTERGNINISELVKQKPTVIVEGAFSSKNCIFKDSKNQVAAKLYRKEERGEGFEFHLASCVNPRLFVMLFIGLQKMIFDDIVTGPVVVFVPTIVV